jgi:hypothetical protein
MNSEHLNLMHRSDALRALHARGIRIGRETFLRLAKETRHGSVLIPGYKCRRLYNVNVLAAAAMKND